MVLWIVLILFVLVVGGDKKCMSGLVILKNIKLIFMLVVNNIDSYVLKLNLGVVWLGLSLILL